MRQQKETEGDYQCRGRGPPAFINKILIILLNK
jgi:hypothetical protein